MEKYLAGFLSPGIAPLALIAVCMWVWAEFKFSTKQRLIYGALAFLLCIATIEGVRLYGLAYERMYVRNSMNVIKDQIKTGNIQPTIDAINKFENIEQNRGFSSAASELWKDFATIKYKMNQEKKSNTEEMPSQKTAQ